MLFEDRRDRDRVSGLTVYCKKCTDERHRVEHEAYLAETRARIAKEAESRSKAIDSLRSMPYPEYLRTEHWQAVRVRAHEADGHACRVCGSTDGLNVHHRTYERRGCELPGDVITLCQPCHQLFHDNGKLAKAEA